MKRSTSIQNYSNFHNFLNCLLKLELKLGNPKDDAALRVQWVRPKPINLKAEMAGDSRLNTISDQVNNLSIANANRGGQE